MILLIAFLLATPPDFSSASNLAVLAGDGGMAENSIALSGSRAVMAVIKKNEPRAIGIFVSSDAGTTWSSAPDREMSIGGKTYAYAWDPWLAVLDDGSFGLTYLASTGTQPALGDMVIAYERSVDGVTWSSPVVMDTTPAPTSPIDKPTLTADRARGTVYLIWTRYTPAGQNSSFLAQNVVAASTDRGATWGQPRTIANAVREGFGQLAVTADGTLVFTAADTSRNAYVARVSTDGGATFSDSVVIGTGGLKFFFPSGLFASWMQNVVAFRGDLYCVYPVWDGIFFTRSRDGGQTWSAPLHLAGRIGNAVRPSIAVDEATGSIIVSWIDCHDDPTGTLYRLYAAQSDDGGTTFSTPLAFSPPFPAGADIGDYNGLVVVRKGTGLTAFSSTGGYLTAARLVLTPPPPRRRAARH